MKFITRATLLSALALAGAALVFAASGQAPVRSNQDPSVSGATRAVQQGKGGGMTRNTAEPNASRSVTPRDQGTLRPDPAVAKHDTGVRK